ncbi:hypothetical protein [Flavobacterium branchiicola]|uniref:Uncharacterized protein n=1 Tax=Flavobacterium branchiicola TaxID=1114875 RepID=A0ABV9PD86_9FLAO|nr:hypothetical protein [Flavobacterium branchiicola]MBS7253331.1 hypothetical protein [Flavobacterium branchiicola]
MKTTFLKSTMPFALVALMGITGAFLTTSMQSASKPPIVGYINSATKPCDVPVSCDSTPSPFLCEASGQQAFGKANNCQQLRYRPVN